MRDADRAVEYDPEWSAPLSPDGFGIVTPACGDRSDLFIVSYDTGVALRIGGEARLCFDCGPDGGVYHPDCVTHGMEAVRGIVHVWESAHIWAQYLRR